MDPRTLSPVDIRKLLAHAQAIQAILTTTPDPHNHRIPQFLQDQTVTAPGERMPIRALYAAYATWSQSRGRAPLPLRPFARHIPNPREKSNGTVWLADIRLR